MPTPFHDFECSSCNEQYLDMPISVDGSKCLNCKSGHLIILWRTDWQRNAQVHPSERSVIYVSDREQKIQYPGRNDVPMPKRLEQRGYRRVELTSIHHHRQLERQDKVVSHVLNYDHGSGRSFDGSDSQ